MDERAEGVPSIADILKSRELDIKSCPEVCARAVWYSDPVFPHLGQYNCPHHFGVTHVAAIIDGEIRCKYFKEKEEAK